MSRYFVLVGGFLLLIIKVDNRGGKRYTEEIGGSKMEISKDSWHFQVYEKWHQRKLGYLPGSLVNLCPYVRVILFYSWARYLFITGTVWPFWTILGLAVEVTLLKASPLRVLKQEALALLFLSTYVFFMCIIFSIQKLFKTSKGASFTQVLATRFHAAHKGVCPTIVIK